MHLGHKHGVSYPLMKRYIFGLRARMQIFDLDITLSHMKRALLITGLVAEKKGRQIIIKLIHQGMQGGVQNWEFYGNPCNKKTCLTPPSLFITNYFKRLPLTSFLE